MGAKAEDIFVDEDSSWNCSCTAETEREKLIDPNLRKDFLAWKKEPSFERGASDFLERLYKEDIDLCLVSLLKIGGQGVPVRGPGGYAKFLVNFMKRGSM